VQGRGQGLSSNPPTCTSTNVGRNFGQMTVTELLEKIRDYYLTRFKQEIDEQRDNGFETIIEPELVDKNGFTITEGFFDTPYRNDLFLLRDNNPIESIMVDTESKLTFNPITLQWTDKLTVTIESFQWNYLTVVFNDDIDLDWTHLKNWFNDSFKEKNKVDDFKLAVHFISDPYKVDNLQMVDLDLGSGTIDDFEKLLDSFDKMSLTSVTVK
jgi:hypothetical protein